MLRDRATGRHGTVPMAGSRICLSGAQDGRTGEMMSVSGTLLT
jgi:hypothetical protein